MKTYHIFCPEYVPLENKGEEAIIRGVEDTVFPGADVQYHVLDMLATEYKFQDGLHIYPGTWFYSDWRSRGFGLGSGSTKVYNSVCSLFRNLLNKLMPFWVTIPHFPVVKLSRAVKRFKIGSLNDKAHDIALKRILECDYIIAGHDGAFDEYECHILDMLYSRGYKFGLYGSSLKPNLKNKSIINLFRKTLENADFIYCRDVIGHAWGQKHFPELKLELLPDPAFGMRPAGNDTALSIITAESLTEFFDKPVIMVTVCEPAPISVHSFKKYKIPAQKIKAHRKAIADLVKYVTDNTDANILFLPHSIGGIDEDDRSISENVINLSGCAKSRVRLLSTVYTARELKALIRCAELLIAERVHSMIGATGVHTPFLALGSNTDARVKGIVGKMLELEDAIYYLNDFNLDELIRKFDYVWENRKELSSRLELKHNLMMTDLLKAGSHIKSVIDSYD